MTVTTQSPARTNGSADHPVEPPRRQVGRRRTLPSGRAVAGGLLVAVAAVGIFAAAQGATQANAPGYVVARTDLPVGTTLTESDLRVTTVDLPAGLAARAFREPVDLVGGVTVAPLAEGDLIQASSVVDPERVGTDPGVGASRQLSFALDTDRAVNGRLDAGERVDILVTYSGGSGAYTEAVVSGATVVGIDSDDSGALRTSGRTVLTVALPGAADALAVAHAVRAGEVTVVRTTGAENADDALSYQPQPPVAGDDKDEDGEGEGSRTP